MSELTRIERLRTALKESQMAFSKRLGVSQATVWRIERGLQSESGPISLLLDSLEREAGATVAALDPPAGGGSSPAAVPEAPFTSAPEALHVS